MKEVNDSVYVGFIKAVYEFPAMMMSWHQSHLVELSRLRSNIISAIDECNDDNDIIMERIELYRGLSKDIIDLESRMEEFYDKYGHHDKFFKEIKD